MSQIQDLVYAIEVGALRVWILRLALMVIMLGFGVYYAATQFNGFGNPEDMDMAQLGRQVALGRGYTTKFIRPTALKEMGLQSQNFTPDQGDFPETVQPPVYPYLLAGIFKISGANFEVPLDRLRELRIFRPEVNVVIFNTILLLLALIVFYVWMMRAFDNRIAIVSCVLVVLSDLMWNFAISGLPVALLMLLVSLMGLLICEAVLADEVENSILPPVFIAMAGLVLGVAILTRYSMLALYLPFVGLGVLGFSRRGSCGFLAAVVPVVIFAPWLIRNLNLTGNLFGHAWLAVYANDSTIWRLFGESLQEMTGLRAFMHTFSHGFENILANLGVLFGGFLVPVFFIGSIFHVFRRPCVQIPRWFWVLSLLLLLCFNAPILNDHSASEKIELNSLFVLFPVLAGYGTAFLFILIDRLKLPSPILQWPIVVLVAALQVAPLGFRVFQRPPALYAYPPYFPPVMVLMKSWIKPQEIMVSDIPWACAWYSDRITIWLPKQKKDMEELNDFHYRIVAMLLTPESRNHRMFSEIENGEYADWAGLIKRDDFRELPLPRFTPLPPNKGDYFIFADRVRWPQ